MPTKVSEASQRNASQARCKHVNDVLIKQLIGPLITLSLYICLYRSLRAFWWRYFFSTAWIRSSSQPTWTQTHKCTCWNRFTHWFHILSKNHSLSFCRLWTVFSFKTLTVSWKKNGTKSIPPNHVICLLKGNSLFNQGHFIISSFFFFFYEDPRTSCWSSRSACFILNLWVQLKSNFLSVPIKLNCLNILFLKDIINEVLIPWPGTF